MFVQFFGASHASFNSLCMHSQLFFLLLVLCSFRPSCVGFDPRRVFGCGTPMVQVSAEHAKYL